MNRSAALVSVWYRLRRLSLSADVASFTRRSLIAALLSVATLCCGPVLAISIWDGGGADDKWTTGANWFALFGSGVAPANNGMEDIVMPASGGAVQTPLVDVPYSIKSLTFGSGNGRFVILVAAELTIGTGGITNNDADIQSIFGPVKLSANQTWSAAAGRLQMDVVNLNGFHLVLSPAAPIDLPSVIVGSGEIEITFQPSTVTMSGTTSNTYSGPTTVRTGTLMLQKSGGATAVPGNLNIGSGATVRLGANEQIAHASGNNVGIHGVGALLDLNVYTETIASLDVGNNGSVTTGTGFFGLLKIGESLQVANNGTVIGNMSLGDVTANIATGGQVTTSSSLDIGEAASGTLNITTGGDVTNSGGRIGNQAGSTGAVTVNGSTASWTNNSSLYIGYEGSGTLGILAGADVSAGAGGIAHSFVGNRNGSSGEVTVDGMGSTWDTTGVLTIGYDNSTGGGGSATVNVRNRGAVTVGSDTRVGRTSELAVSGLGSFTTGGKLTLDGTLAVNSSATVRFADGTFQEGATVTVQNGASVVQSGSLDLVRGVTMEINSGAAYTVSQLVRVGTLSGPASKLIIDGQGTLVSSDFAIDVGYGGTGEMTVSGGGRVESVTGAVGSYQFGSGTSIGTLTLDGTDASGNPSSWLIDYGPNMGLSPTSQGTISILNGALLRTVNSMSLGQTGSGVVLVSGRDGAGHPSLMDVGSLAIAETASSTGELSATEGGRIEVGALALAPNGGTATLTITDVGSTLVQSGASTIVIGNATTGTAALNVRNNATLTTGTGPVDVRATGQINLESGAVFDAHGPINMNGGQFNFLGGTLHVDNFNGNLINQGGTLAPGHSVGTTAFSGSYTQRAAAALEIEIAGVLPGDWDVLTAEGNASLDGRIEVVLRDDFEPVLGNSFTVISTNVGNIGGQFDTEQLPIFNGLTFDVVYNLKSVVLQVVETVGLAGDYNENGVVDAADYVVWRDKEGTTNMLPNDPIGGVIDSRQYGQWRANFGRAAGSGSADFGELSRAGASPSHAAVPEPGGLILLCFGVAAARFRARRNGSRGVTD